MRVLLDSNIIINREAYKVSNPYIGQLYYWLDKLKYEKVIHPITQNEILGHKNPDTSKSMEVKLEAYTLMKTSAPLYTEVKKLSDKVDLNENDTNDSLLLNELVQDRVDLFITEDRKIHRKAVSLGIADKVFTISRFVEKIIAEHPELVDYKVLSITKKYFGAIDINDTFFDSFREDYQDFNKWFNKKSDEIAYVSYVRNIVVGFLFVKVEGTEENYNNITPKFHAKKRLKIGTLKVVLNGYRIGERFLKIIFDNALLYKVDEIYVTIFEKRPEQLRLIELFLEWGFQEFGTKETPTGTEKVFVRDFSKRADRQTPKVRFPFISKSATPYIVPIYPDYHTELLPDSILNNESPANFIENQPHRNALSKVYISHSYERGLTSGDIILFYRTGGYYAGVATTIGIVEKIYTDINTPDELYDICRKKTFFTEQQLLEFWNRYKTLKPFVVEFLYTYSLPKRPNLARLIEMGIIADIQSVPRGFSKITQDQLLNVLKASQSDENIVVN